MDPRPIDRSHATGDDHEPRAVRRWERDTGKPSVRDIDNVVVAGFRQTLIDAGCSPNYIRSMWITIRAVLRRIGPPVTGNPFGLGIIERIPAMKPVARRHKLPRRVTMDELNHAYVAMKQMKIPRRGYPAAMFWQAFLVMAYTTGLRRGDLMAIRWEHVDVDRCALFVSVSKTGVEAELPLHSVAIEHLQRIRSGGNPLVFGPVCERSFYDHWREIKSHAKVDFMPHDIRRTACSEVDKVERGMGKVLMLHAPSNVTEASYLNALPDVIERMELPISFKHGIKMAERALARSRRARMKMHSDKFALPELPSVEQFEFVPGGFMFAGRSCMLRGHKWRLLRCLVKAEGPVGYREMYQACYGRDADGEDWERVKRLCKKHVTYLRQRMREFLAVPDDWNPIPVVASEQWSEDTKYMLSLPPVLKEGVA